MEDATYQVSYYCSKRYLEEVQQNANFRRNKPWTSVGKWQMACIVVIQGILETPPDQLCAWDLGELHRQYQVPAKK